MCCAGLLASFMFRRVILPWLRWLCVYGETGVCIFFCLSGYVIVRGLRSGLPRTSGELLHLAGMHDLMRGAPVLR